LARLGVGHRREELHMRKCLNPFCEAAKPRQIALTTGQQLKVAESWSPEGDRCSFCGAVHSNSLFEGRRLRGFLDGWMMPRGWKPHSSDCSTSVPEI
jgi:hypothetical protein